jgi:thiamine pyrophosphokinase
MNQRVVVVAGGSVTGEFLQANISTDDLVIGVDNGVITLLEAGILPAFAVGDFDTAGKEQFAEWRALGIEIMLLSSIKDVTDTRAALEHALTFSPSSILILGGLGGGRLDHTVANISLLEWLAAHQVEGILQNETNRLRLLLGPGEMNLVREGYTYVSLLPISKTVDGVSTTGLAYPLHEKQLSRIDTLGISNEILEDSATVSITQGKCLVIESKDF